MCRGGIRLSQGLDREALAEAWVRLDTWHLLDEFDGPSVTLLSFVAADFEFSAPCCDFKYRGLSDFGAYVSEFQRAVPDLSVTVHEVTMGPNTADVTFKMSGTILQAYPMEPMFPRGKFFEWTGVTSLTFDNAGCISKEVFHLLLDVSPSPQICDGLVDAAWVLASTKPGSELLQQVIERTRRVDVLEQLSGNIPKVARCHNGNHVLQTYIVAMPPAAAQFIIDGLVGYAVAAAHHHTACRVLQRVLEHCPQQQVAPLAEELLKEMQDLITHCYGNYVAQRLLEHGTQETRQRVVDVICAGDAKFLARHWVANNVLRCAFIHCSCEDRTRLAHAIAPDPLELKELSKHRNGSFLARDVKLALRCRPQ